MDMGLKKSGIVVRLRSAHCREFVCRHMVSDQDEGSSNNVVLDRNSFFLPTPGQLLTPCQKGEIS